MISTSFRPPRHDAVRTHAVQRSQQQRAPVGHQSPGHYRCTRDPCHAFVTKTASRVAPPAVFFQAHGWRAVGPSQQQAHHRCAKSPRPEQSSDCQRNQRPDHCYVQAPLPRHAARRDGPIRFVNGVDMAVIPIVDGLAGGAHQRASQRHANYSQRPFALQRHARRHHATGKRPHRREPSHGLEQLRDHSQRRALAHCSRDCS